VIGHHSRLVDGGDWIYAQSLAAGIVPRLPIPSIRAKLHAVPMAPARRVDGSGTSDDFLDRDRRACVGAEKGNYCAAVASAAGAQSWAVAPDLHSAMVRAVRNAKTPIFFFQAANDYDLSPSETLAATMKQANKEYELKINPAYGDSPQDGHAFGYFGPPSGRMTFSHFSGRIVPRSRR
jgi:hypothetical protein